MLSSRNTFDFDVLKNILVETQSGLSFRDKGLKLDSAEDAKDIISALNSTKNLEYFDLQGNTLGVQASKAIAQALENHPELKRALWKDMFTGRLRNEIPKSLEYFGDALIKANCQLYELDLSENALGEIAINALAKFLTSKSGYSLKELRLNNNGLGISGGKALAAAMNNTLSNQSSFSLKVFIAGRNRLENEGTKALAAVFKKMKSLEEIQMPQNGIHVEGICEMFYALSYNKSLKIINFNDNIVKPDGCTYITKALTSLRYLESLDLGDCLIKDNGALHLARSLARYQQELRELVFDSNEIKLEAILEIIDLIGSKPFLQKLSFNGNLLSIHDVGIIQTKMDSIDRLEVLGSFSDNETFDDDIDEGGEFISDPDDDDEGNGDDIEDDESNNTEVGDEIDEDDDDNDDDYESGTNQANEEDNSIISNEYEKVEFSDVTESELLENSSNLLKKIELLSQYNNEKDNREFCTKSLDILLKLASNYNEPDVNNVYETCEQIFKKIIEHIDKFGKHQSFNDILLVDLKLIKSEDKSFKVSWKLSACYILLLRFAQNSLLRKDTLHYLKTFIERVDNKSNEMLDFYNYIRKEY